jgi:hypothetical protein
MIVDSPTIAYFFMDLPMMSPDIRMLWVKPPLPGSMEKQELPALRSDHFYRHIIQFHRYRHETDSL